MGGANIGFFGIFDPYIDFTIYKCYTSLVELSKCFLLVYRTNPYV